MTEEPTDEPVEGNNNEEPAEPDESSEDDDQEKYDGGDVPRNGE